VPHQWLPAHGELVPLARLLMALSFFLHILPIAGRVARPAFSHACSSRLAAGTSVLRTRHLCAVAPPPARGAEGAPAQHHSAERTSLYDLPDFRGPARLQKQAYKDSKLVVPSSKIANAKKRAIRLATQTIDAYAQGLSVPLREQLAAFRGVLRGLPPFEAALAELTLAALEREKGGRALRDIIADFDVLRRTVVRVGKEASAEAAQAASTSEARALAEDGVERVAEAFEEGSWALLALIKTSQSLRRLPRPTADDPVLVLVGMPNVGKSSIVTATSTGPRAAATRASPFVPSLVACLCAAIGACAPTAHPATGCARYMARAQGRRRSTTTRSRRADSRWATSRRPTAAATR